jgi:hypothetical protein
MVPWRTTGPFPTRSKPFAINGTAFAFVGLPQLSIGISI